MSKITAQQEVFAQRYLVHFNAKLAAEEAGYSKRRAKVTGCELLKKDHVQSYMAGLAAQLQQDNKIDAEYVLQGAKEMFERCMQREQVYEMSNGEKVPTGEWKFDSAGAGKALTILGNHVDISAFKAKDDDGVPVDQNWKLEIVHTTVDAKDHPSCKT